MGPRQVAELGSQQGELGTLSPSQTKARLNTVLSVTMIELFTCGTSSLISHISWVQWEAVDYGWEGPCSPQALASSWNDRVAQPGTCRSSHWTE